MARSKTSYVALLSILPPLACMACGEVDRDRGSNRPDPLCQASLDLNGDGHADLVVPERPEWEAGGGAAPGWRATVYLGAREAYQDPIELAWKSGWGTNLVAYSRGDARGLGVTDVGFYPYQSGAADPSCDFKMGLRAEGDLGAGAGTLVLHELSTSGCPSTGAATETPLGDLNGDGAGETLRWTEGDATVWLELVSASGEVVASLTDGSGGGQRAYVGVGDVDDDGVPDALGFERVGTSGAIHLLPGRPEGLGAPVAYAELGLPNAALAERRLLGDVNGDGRFDFAVSSVKTPVNAEIVRYVALSRAGSGGLAVEYELVHHADGEWGALEPAGDIDCDGRDDVLARFYDPALGADHSELVSYHGSESGIRPARRLIVPRRENGTDVLPLFTPFYRR